MSDKGEAVVKPKSLAAVTKNATMKSPCQQRDKGSGVIMSCYPSSLARPLFSLTAQAFKDILASCTWRDSLPLGAWTGRDG